MPTLDTILKELKNVPVDRLKDLYSIIHSLRTNTKKTDKASKKILSFAGSLSGLTEKDYNDFLNQTKETRNDLFDRDIAILSLHLLTQTSFLNFFVAHPK